MDNTKDAVAVLRMMVAPLGARIEARAIIYAIEELTRRELLPAEIRAVRASRDRWREVSEALVGALADKDSARLSKALKIYKALLTLPADPDETRTS